jgi:hypothetical protein
MLIYNMESQWWRVDNGGVHIVEINQPPYDTFAVYSLTKARGGGGFGGIVACDGEDLGASGYPPAHFRRQMQHISFGIVAQADYAEAMITLFREV